MIVIDDFLDNDYLNHIQDTIPNLHYKLHFSEDPNDRNFLNSVGDFPHTDSLNTLAKKILNLTDIQDCNIIRFYVNLNPQGEYHSGRFHIDSENGITALFYPYPWEKEWGGGTEFEDGTKIEYKMNRLVLFDANRPHRAVEHTAPNFRYTIAFKLEARWRHDWSDVEIPESHLISDNNFTQYGFIDTSCFSIDESDWDNEFTKMRNEEFAVHRSTSVIPLMWSMQGFAREKEYINPKTRFFEKYYNESFFDNLLKLVGGTHIVRIVLAKLHKHGEIYPHVDDGDSLTKNRRIHIPIVTNENVIFNVGGETRTIKQGEIVRINNSVKHGVVNNSDEDRIHLIVDIYDEDSINN